MKERVIRNIQISYYICLFFFCILTAFVFNLTIAHGLVAFIVLATFIACSLNNKWVI